VDPRTIVHRQTYGHPVFDAASMRAQARGAEINGVRRTWYCGAYWGFGFHEDGVQSAIALCNALERHGLPPRSQDQVPATAPKDAEAADAQLYLSGTR
jgi:predicted NAD/FAD-binding protein